MSQAEETLRRHYDDVALSGDDRATALDYNLRDLEITLAAEYIRDGDRLLDVGCGMAVALRRHASERSLAAAVGVDYAANMVRAAQEKVREAGLGGRIDIREGSALELPFEDGSFDVVTSHRCLLALLEWERQQAAIREMHRVVAPGGFVLLMEGTVDGLHRLNFYRQAFGLPLIDEGGRDGFERQLFREKALFDFVAPMFEVVRVQRFGMYYFLTRILQPLFAAPEPPRYDHPLNDAARKIAAVIPDFESIGQVVGFVLRRRGSHAR